MVGATRARNLLENDDSDDRVSSPDPLALSFDGNFSPDKSNALREKSPNKKLFSSPTRRGQTSTTREPGSPGSKASPSKAPGTPKRNTPSSKGSHAEDATIGDTIILTPRRRDGRDTPGGQSPRRIKVTVEEMNEDEVPNTRHGASGNLGERITRVPLNQKEDGSPRPRKRKGRPSKTATKSPTVNEDGAPPKRKRKSTATKPFGNKRRQSGFVADLGIGNDAPEGNQEYLEQPTEQSGEQINPTPAKKKRGRPRKSDVDPAHANKPDSRSVNPKSAEAQRVQGRSNDIQPDANDNSNDKVSVEISNTSFAQGSGQKQAGAAGSGDPNSRRKQIDFSKMSPLNRNPNYARFKHQNPATPESESLHLKSVRRRVPTPVKPQERNAADGSEDGDQEGSQENENRQNQPPETNVGAVDGASTSHRVRSPALEVDAGMDSESDGEAEQWDPDMEDTAALDRSAVESEGFSMVSLEALKGQKEAAEREAVERSQQEKGTIQQSSNAKHRDASIEFNSNQRHDDESASRGASIHSRLPTPQDGSAQHDDGSRRVEDATDPTAASSRDTDSNQRTEMQNRPQLFHGFGTGTRRDLRAGFMVGELLGRGERNLNVPAGGPRSTSVDVASAKEAASTHHPKPSVIPPYPSLPTPAQSSETESRQVSLNHQQRPIAGNEVYPDTNTRANGSNGRKDVDAMSWRSTNPNVQQNEERNRTYDEMSWEASRSIGRQYSGVSGFGGHFGAQTHQRPKSDLRDPQNYQTGDQLSAQRYDVDKDEEMVDALEDGYEEEGSPPQEDQTLGDADIWREEADRSLEDSMENQRDRLKRSTDNNAGSTNGPREEAQHEPRRIVPFSNLPAPSPIPSLSDLLPEDTRPPRSKLPRTWRKSNGNDDFIYSDEAEEPESSVLGTGSMPPSVRKEIARSQKEQQKDKKRKSFQFENRGTPGGGFGSAIIPSVFKRWGFGTSGDAQKKEDARAEDATKEPQNAYSTNTTDGTPSQQRQASKSPPKGILATPQRRRAEGTPAKEVRFQPNAAVSTVEEEGQPRLSSSFRSSSRASPGQESDRLQERNTHVCVEDDSQSIDEPSSEDHEDSGLSANLDVTFIGQSQVSSSPAIYRGRHNDQSKTRQDHSSSTHDISPEGDSQVNVDARDVRAFRRDMDALDARGRAGASLTPLSSHKDTDLETSEVRQLRKELKEMRNMEDMSFSEHSMSMRSNREQPDVSEYDDDGGTRKSALLQPRKRYPKLFDESATLSAEEDPGPQHSAKQRTQEVSRAAPSQPIVSQLQQLTQQAQAGLFSRLTSWFSPPNAIAAALKGFNRQNRFEPLLWTHNHHYLLVHYYKHALWLESQGDLATSSNTSETGSQLFPAPSLPPPGAALPACFFMRTLPKDWACFVGRNFKGIQSCKRGLPPKPHEAPGDEDYMCDPRLGKCEFGLPHQSDIDRDEARGVDVYKKYSSFQKRMNETEIRIAYAFAHTVAEDGLEMLNADDAVKIGAVAPPRDGNAKGRKLKGPVRDEDGTVMRVKQDWWSETNEGRAQIVWQVFTLWIAWILEGRKKSNARG